MTNATNDFVLVGRLVYDLPERLWSSVTEGLIRVSTDFMSQLSVRDITVKFGGITALDSASFDVEKGQICGLIGPNGAGKTTLFNVVSRIYDPTEGSVEFEGQDLLALQAHEICKVGAYRTFQNLALWKGLTVL